MRHAPIRHYEQFARSGHRQRAGAAGRVAGAERSPSTRQLRRRRPGRARWPRPAGAVAVQHLDARVVDHDGRRRVVTAGPSPPSTQCRLDQPQRFAGGRVDLAVPDAGARPLHEHFAGADTGAPGRRRPRGAASAEHHELTMSRRGGRASRSPRPARRRARRPRPAEPCDDVVRVVVRAGGEAVPRCGRRRARSRTGRRRATRSRQRAVVGGPREQVVDIASVLTTRLGGDAARDRALAAVGLPVELARARARRCRSRTRSRSRRASSSSRSGGSSRSGRELISTATPNCSHAAKTSSASNSDSGRVPRPPVTSRPVQWPSTSVCGLEIAATIRGVISSDGMRSFECTLGDDHVEPGEQRRLLVERAVVEDVDLDAGEQPERRAARALSSATTSSCCSSRSADSPLATVSRGEWSVSTR